MISIMYELSLTNWPWFDFGLCYIPLDRLPISRRESDSSRRLSFCLSALLSTVFALIFGTKLRLSSFKSLLWRSKSATRDTLTSSLACETPVTVEMFTFNWKKHSPSLFLAYIKRLRNYKCISIIRTPVIKLMAKSKLFCTLRDGTKRVNKYKKCEK